MKALRSPELRGILGLVLVILLIGGLLAVTTGKLEQWFGISLFAGPQALDKIVFVSDRSGTSEIYVMGLDGGSQTAVTKDTGVLSAPAISSSGRKIAFVSRHENQDQVFTISPGGGRPDILTSATGPKKSPSYSPDGKKLAFIGSGKVYVSEPNGDNIEPVLPTPEELHAAMSDPLRTHTPAYYDFKWQTSGTGLLGVTRDQGDSDVLTYLPSHEGEASQIPLRQTINEVIGRTGVPGKMVAEGERVRASGIGWAADAEEFAVSATTRSSSYLLVFSLQSGKLALAGFKAFDGQELSSPGLSPDGSQLAVGAKSLNKKASSGLLIIDMQSGEAHIVAGGLFANPSYSPSGDRILAVSTSVDGEKRDVVVIDPQSGDVKQLTKDGHSFDAIWTPASQK